MSELNKFQIIGNLTKDPELRETSSGTAYALISIAQNKKWKTKSGEKKEKSLYFSLFAYGVIGEVLHKYLRKGSKLFAEGNVEPYDRLLEDGTKTYGFKFTIEEFQFLDKKPKDALAEAKEIFPDDEIVDLP